jgi:hypothetical protein
MMLDGSSLRVTHDQSSRSFEFVKPKDTGRTEQTIQLVLEEALWSGSTFDAAARVLRTSPVAPSLELVGRSPGRMISCTLVGQPAAMEFLTNDLLSRLAPILDIGVGDSFTLRLEGAMNHSIWRRMNEGSFRDMAAPRQPRLLRWFANRQLRRREKERAGKHMDTK